MAFLSASAAQERNLALNRPYTYHPGATYPHTKDDGDAAQLTDGQRATGEWLWTDKKAVGWSWPKGPITITVDLGQRQPIGGVSLSTAGGRAGVTFPFAVYVLISDDGLDFYAQGDLLAHSARDGWPSPLKYSLYTYRGRGMLSRGRYVRFVIVPSGQFFMCDEIEVLAGSAEQDDRPRSKPVSDIGELVASQKLATIVNGRIALDLKALEGREGASGRHEHLWKELLEGPPVQSIDWRRGLPYNDLHRRVWAAHGKAARESFQSPLLVWRSSRWDPLDPLDLPEEAPTVSPVEIHAFDGEYRSAAFNVTNLSDDAVRLAILPSLDGLLVEMLEVSEVIYVEAQGRTVVANALVPVPYTSRGWSISVPAGATRQVWLTAHPVGVEPRTYNCRLTLQCKKLRYSQEVPLRLVVHPFQFPRRPTLAATVWDYCHAGGYIRLPDTWRYAIQQMREHFIDVPWFGMNAVVWRGKGVKPWIDDKGNITAHILWSRLDEWIRLWPDARYYALCLEWRQVVPDVGLRLGDPVHERALQEYFQLIVTRFADHGVPADRIMILPVDEPWQDSKSQAQIGWARFIKEACPDVTIFSDPTWKFPSKAPPALYDTADIICPNLPLYYGQSGAAASAASFYQRLRKQGKALWTYQCSGPVKTLDPYSYFRLQAWHAFREGMTGMGFWALADMRHQPFGTTGSWNDFSLMGTNFSITYWDAYGVTDSKQLEAIREGIEDYEYLVMLRDAIKGKPGEQAAAAKELLERAVEQIGGAYSIGSISWRGDRDRDAADRARIEIIEQLLELR